MKNGSAGGYHLANGLFKLGIGRVLSVYIVTADFPRGSIVYHEGTIKCSRMV